MKLKWPQKKSTKTGKNFRGGGGIFWLARKYTPDKNIMVYEAGSSARYDFWAKWF